METQIKWHDLHQEKQSEIRKDLLNEVIRDYCLENNVNVIWGDKGYEGGLTDEQYSHCLLKSQESLQESFIDLPLVIEIPAIN